MDAAPSSPKRPKLDNGAGAAYIPTQEHTDGEPTFAVIFSLHEEKGALARALKPFEVRDAVVCVCVSVSVCPSVFEGKTFVTFVVSPLFWATQEVGINMTHIESRPSKANPGKEYDFYVDYICSEEKRAELVAKLKEYTTSINLLSRSPQKDEGI